MGSKLKKALPLIAGVGLMMTPGGQGIGAKLMAGGAKKFLMNQALTAALSKATTGKIDPKAQLTAGLFSGIGSMASANAAKIGASQLGGVANTGLQAGDKYANLSAALNKADPSFLNQIGAQRAASAPGLAGIFQKAGNAINTGFANPMSLKGAMAYGAPAAIGAGLSAMNQKKEPLDTSKDDDAAQAAYDYHMMMSKGIMSPEDARTAFASYGKGMKGDYTPGTEMGTGRYEELYPQLNYTGLTKYNPNPNEMLGAEQAYKKKLREYNPYVMAPGMAEGGMIDPLEEMPIITPMETEEERRMREAMEQIKMLQAEGFDFSQGNPVPDPYAEAPMTSMNYEGRANGGFIGFDMGGYASFKDVIEQFAESLSPDEFDEFIEMNRDDQIRIMTNAGVLRDDYAAGGSVPQTESIPQGMQLDGRGGGFIPMGAKEKHDDVPAMLAKNEFVMTSDAVRAAGGGSIEKGAQRMYDMMNQLEAQV